MARWGLATLLLAVLTGCRQPVKTDSRITLNGPVSAQVTAAFPSQSDGGPLLKMLVDGRDLPGSCPEVAVVEVDGLLFNVETNGAHYPAENPVALFREKLDCIAKDSRIVAVVLRISSPGGSVAGSDILRRELVTFRRRSGKPVVACVVDVGAGGAYYLATAADCIVAHPMSIVGGVGVILNHFSLLDTMAQFNVIGRPIKSGRFINMGSVAQPLEEEARAMLQTMADSYHGRFVQIIVESRPGVDANTPTNFDGRIFTADQALARGLIDQVGYFNDAIGSARHFASCGETRVVMLRRRDNPARTPFDAAPPAAPMVDFPGIHIPGLERSCMPAFLYLWQLDPIMEAVAAKRL